MLVRPRGRGCFNILLTTCRQRPRLAPFATERAYANLVHGKDVEDLRNYSISIADEMREQLPVTIETVRLAAQRQRGRLTEYALLGAALSRQFGIDCASSESVA